jgi:hypothetical protein
VVNFHYYDLKFFLYISCMYIHTCI